MTATMDGTLPHQGVRLDAASNAFPSPRWGARFYDFVISVQGGGVYVNGDTVTFDNCNIHNNQANEVRALLTHHHTPLSHRPDG